MASSGVDAEQLRRLRIEVADVAVLVDGVHALDDAGEHRLGLGLAPAAASHVRSTRLRRMSSMVRASCPDLRRRRRLGIEVEKSPAPRRMAASVSARTGRAMSSLEHHAGEHAPAAARMRAVSSRRAGQVTASAVSTAVVGSRVSMSAMASPLEANTGIARGVQTSLRIDALHRGAPVGQGAASAAA